MRFPGVAARSRFERRRNRRRLPDFLRFWRRRDTSSAVSCELLPSGRETCGHSSRARQARRPSSRAARRSRWVRALRISATSTTARRKGLARAKRLQAAADRRQLRHLPRGQERGGPVRGARELEPGAEPQGVPPRSPRGSPKRPSEIVAIDLQPMAPIEGVVQIQGDITSLAKVNECSPLRRQARRPHVSGRPDVTVSDMDEFMQVRQRDTPLLVSKNSPRTTDDACASSVLPSAVLDARLAAACPRRRIRPLTPELLSLPLSSSPLRAGPTHPRRPDRVHPHPRPRRRRRRQDLPR